MKGVLSFFFVVLAGSVGGAQGTPEDEAYWASIGLGLAELRSCTASQDSVTCIGVFADECMTTPDQSHVEQGNCVAQELKLWQVLQSDTLADKLEEARREDQGEALLGMASGGGRAELLIQSRSRWIDYAQAQCALEERRWGAGTIGMTERPYCHIRMVAGRLEHLKNLDM